MRWLRGIASRSGSPATGAIGPRRSEGPHDKRRGQVKRSISLTASAVMAAALVIAACGSSSKSSSGGGGSSSSSTSAQSAETGGAKGGTMIVRANAAPAGSPDPQVNYTAQEWQFLIITHDGLVGFKHAGGTEGTKLVADLATEVPKPTDGGKTYTFTLRPNMKFSDGKAVTANDVKATLSACSRSATAPTRAVGTTSSRAATRASSRRSRATSPRASSSTATRSRSTSR